METNKDQSRRIFIKKAALGTGGLALGFSAKSYARIVGSNDRVQAAIAGINSRGGAHISAINTVGNGLEVRALCDVDSRLFPLTFERYPSLDSKDIETYTDIRKVLDNKDIDLITIATPDHWHAPMAIMAMNAGKHVYLEKPFSHNPQEGEWLIQVQKKTGKSLQIGNQQRSAPTSIELKNEIDKGLIGEPYYGKAWYSNNRQGIGKGQKAPVPDWLDWELWQGPAPRKEFKDNYVHYNWHWFWHWGTGEINNNGLHELDIARWMLGADIPGEVNSSGGRYSYDDDWEFYDTQVANFTFPEGKMITWEGTSCRTYPQHHNRGRGTLIYGTEGSVLVDRGGYQVFDKTGNIIEERTEKLESASTDIQGVGGLDGYHMRNLLDSIREGVKLNSPANEAHKSTLMCHLGNMAQSTGETLKIDTSNGKPKNKQAMKLWSREYEKGWKPSV